MGLLNLFSKPAAPTLTRLPSGSFTIDPEGKILTSTLPQSFPEVYVQEIIERVLTAFRAAQEAQMPLSEFVIHYSALKVLARELRGGAMVFLMPQTLLSPRPKPSS